MIQPGHQVLYRETHVLLDELGTAKLPESAAEDLLEVVIRHYERASTPFTSNRPVEDWGRLLGDTAAVGALLDRLLHHGHVLNCDRETSSMDSVTLTMGQRPANRWNAGSADRRPRRQVLTPLAAAAPRGSLILAHPSNGSPLLTGGVVTPAAISHMWLQFA